MHFGKEIGVGVKGRQNLQVLVNNNVVRETGFHKNMILNTWFNDIFNEAATNTMNEGALTYNHCSVGTGTTAPEVTDVNLTAFLAGKQYMDTDAVVTSLGVTNNVLTIQVRRTWTFAESAVIGNVSETATVNGGTAAPVSNTRMHTKALVLDTGGTPTSIPVGTGEQLRVIHDTLITFNMVRSSQNIDVTTGGNTTSHLVEIEFCNIGSTFFEFLFAQTNFRGNKSFKPKFTLTSLTFNAGYGAPTKGTATTLTGVTAVNTFAGNGLGCSIVYTIPSTSGNSAGGVGGIVFNSTSGTEQLAMKFTPVLPKSSLNKLVFTMTFSFTRA